VIESGKQVFLTSLLSRASTKTKMVLMLHYWDDLSPDEVHTVLGDSASVGRIKQIIEAVERLYERSLAER